MFPKMVGREVGSIHPLIDIFKVQMLPLFIDVQTRSGPMTPFNPIGPLLWCMHAIPKKYSQSQQGKGNPRRPNCVRPQSATSTIPDFPPMKWRCHLPPQQGRFHLGMASSKSPLDCATSLGKIPHEPIKLWEHCPPHI